MTLASSQKSTKPRSTDSIEHSGNAVVGMLKSQTTTQHSGSDVSKSERTTPTEEILSYREEYEQLIQSDQLPENAKELLGHLVDCLGGKVPDCSTCLDEENVPCKGGWCRCPDCREY